MVLFGSHAVNSFRVEKGFKVRTDLDYVHYSEAGIAPFVSKKRNFLGRDDERVPNKLPVTLFVDTDCGWEWSVCGDSPIYHYETGKGSNSNQGKLAGYVTSSARGAVTGRAVALGYVFSSSLESGGRFAVRCLGHEWNCEVLNKPPVPFTRS